MWTPVKAAQIYAKVENTYTTIQTMKSGSQTKRFLNSRNQCKKNENRNQQKWPISCSSLDFVYE